jgi:hypothetical protein
MNASDPSKFVGSLFVEEMQKTIARSDDTRKAGARERLSTSIFFMYFVRGTILKRHLWERHQEKPRPRNDDYRSAIEHPSFRAPVGGEELETIFISVHAFRQVRRYNPR